MVDYLVYSIYYNNYGGLSMAISDFERIKEASLAHQIIKAGRLINDFAISRMKERLGLKSLTYAHLELFSYIEFEGTSISEIAKRKGVSKQSVSVLAAQLIDMGLCFFEVSDKDKRQKLLKFQTEGEVSIYEGMKELQSVDLLISEGLEGKHRDAVLMVLSKIIADLSS
jgi:DNA-binding MarR family transcriptional regulator